MVLTVQNVNAENRKKEGEKGRERVGEEARKDGRWKLREVVKGTCGEEKIITDCLRTYDRGKKGKDLGGILQSKGK